MKMRLPRVAGKRGAAPGAEAHSHRQRLRRGEQRACDGQGGDSMELFETMQTQRPTPDIIDYGAAFSMRDEGVGGGWR